MSSLMIASRDSEKISPWRSVLIWNFAPSGMTPFLYSPCSATTGSDGSEPVRYRFEGGSPERRRCRRTAPTSSPAWRTRRAATCGACSRAASRSRSSIWYELLRCVNARPSMRILSMPRVFTPLCSSKSRAISSGDRPRKLLPPPKSTPSNSSGAFSLRLLEQAALARALDEPRRGAAMALVALVVAGADAERTVDLELAIRASHRGEGALRASSTGVPASISLSAHSSPSLAWLAILRISAERTRSSAIAASRSSASAARGRASSIRAVVAARVAATAADSPD
jgi:hypothetical protein